MAAVIVAPVADRDVQRLIGSHSLPADTKARVDRAILRLASFPQSGPALHGRWGGHRYILGPWPWMIIVYVYDEGTETVRVVTVQDARRSSSPFTE